MYGVPIQARASTMIRFLISADMAALRERVGNVRVVIPMNLASHMTNAAGGRPDDRDFAEWLRRTARRLKDGELPPEPWELHQSPFEDSAAQRRIAKLIASIAEKTKYKRD
jgi:hypothetical protein